MAHNIGHVFTIYFSGPNAMRTPWRNGICDTKREDIVLERLTRICSRRLLGGEVLGAIVDFVHCV